MPRLNRRSVLIGAGAACLSPLARAAEPLKIAFVYTGPIGDLGYSYQHEQGRLAVQAKFSGQIATHYVENVAEGPDAERVFRQLAGGGDGMVFSTSFGFMNAVLRVARQSPDIKFEQATGYKTSPNVAEYNSRFYEGRAVCGTIAGHVSKAGIAGFVVSFPIPEVIMGINAFTLAAQKINPKFRTRVIFVSSWFDPGREADAAKALLDQGADILTAHTDSPAAMQVAQSRGAFAFGQSSDQTRFGPQAHLTSIIDDWSPYYIERVQAALDGSWKTASVWLGMKEGMVVMAPYGPGVTPAARAAADRVKTGIIDGSFQCFAGPITDQAGTLRAPVGQVVSDESLLKMDWYVAGVQA